MSTQHLMNCSHLNNNVMQEDINKRWCILSTPRSGTTYLEKILVSNISKTNKSFLVLGELYHPVNWEYEEYIDNVRKELYSSKNLNDVIRQNFIKTMFERLSNNSDLGCTIRLFIESHILDIDYDEIVKKLENLNFKFVYLNRNTFDKTISLAMAETTDVWHRLSESNKSIHKFENTEFTANPKPIVIPSIVFAECYAHTKLHEYYLEPYLKNIKNISTINYDSMLLDCQSIGIDTKNDPGIKKTYDAGYESLIVNYKELTEIYKKLQNG